MRHFKLLIIMTIFISCISHDENSLALKAEAFKAKIENEDVQLIDIRSPKEFSAGHIKKAVNINYFSKNFQDSIRLLKTTLPIFVYCRSGKRSSKSIALFKSVGFDSIYQLEGGLSQWKSHGFGVEED